MSREVDSGSNPESGSGADVAARSVSHSEQHDLRGVAANTEPPTDQVVVKPLTGIPVQWVGPFRLVRSVGAGGMGQVYEAVQLNPGRSVAIKLLHMGGLSEMAKQRFMYESRILARLQHPAIAHVYDSGTVEIDGRVMPWYAMELVDGGRTLRDEIREHAGEIDHWLGTFIKVCEGVAHAHRRGVIHRDLKPSNVLIDEHGNPKLIDFGVAKSLDTDPDLPVLTRVGQVMGTLEYMSPEQAAGHADGVDIRADVYALGVILYELLVGRRPYHLNFASLREKVDAICNTPIEDESLTRRRVPGDLRMIVRTALAKDRDLRYGSAAELAADLRRFQNDEPVEARAPGLVPQLRSFARRHRFFAASATVLFLATTVGAGGAAYGWAQATEAREQAQRERDEAQRQRETAEHAKKEAEWSRDFSTGILLSADPWETAGQDVTVREMLDASSAKLATEVDVNPAVQFEARKMLAEVYGHLYAHEESLREANIALALSGGDPSLADERLSVMLTKAMALEGLDRREESLAQARLAVEAHENMYGDDDARTWEARSTLASALASTGRLEEGEALLERTVSALASKRGPTHDSTLTVKAQLARARLNAGHASEAEGLWKEVVDARRQQHGPDHPLTLQNQFAYARGMMEAGDPARAAEILPDLIERLGRVMGESHEFTAQCMGLLAVCYRRLERYEEAYDLTIEVIEVDTKRLGPRHLSVLRARNNLGLILRGLKRHDEALALYGELLDIWRTLPKDEEGSYLVVAINYSSVMADLGRARDAVPVLREFLARGKRDYPADFWIFEVVENQIAKAESRPEVVLESDRARALHRRPSGAR